MTLESILRSIREILAYIPWPHWVAIGVLTLAVVLLALWRSAERRSSFYGAVALGIAVFAGLLFIETTVVIRWCGIVTNGWGVHLNLDFKRILFLHSQGYESLFNIVAFVPFGFFLAEYLYVTTNRPPATPIAADGADAADDSSAAAVDGVAIADSDSSVAVTGERPAVGDRSAAFVPCDCPAVGARPATVATGDRPASRPLNCWRRLALATLVTLALSLIIECLQLALHVGFFELTDLMMNTLGGLLGACLSLLMRVVFYPSKK